MEKLHFHDASKIYFTSDTHFHHENIIKYCKRPFINVDEMDAELIRRWNEKVPEDGIVFHLGDVGFAQNKYLSDVLRQLHGEIYLIIGNHDWHGVVSQQKWRFKVMCQQMNLTINNQHIILNHYPLLTFAGAYRNSWQLFGHVHTSPYSEGLDSSRMSMLFPTQYDVGVDNNDFTPISFNEVNQIIYAQINSYSNLDSNSDA